MFISDSLLVIPLFLIFVMLAMLVREHMNLVVLGLLLSIFGWAWDARLIRSVILSLREREFTKTAILSGTGDGQAGMERIYALCHAVDLLDFDQ
jgi:peptide/nickel transport system permease protein